ncbi:glycosyltransferase [Opitutales bacterium]|nr:glycosyltransferase [Opitutales bacterium]
MKFDFLVKKEHSDLVLEFIEISVENPKSRSFDSAKICICLATYNPNEALFKRQIDSIANQKEQDFVCIISDDASSPEKRKFIRHCISQYPRFHMIENDRRVGFYHNFERALNNVPDECSFVALSDQDDFWYPNKLTTLISSFQDNVNLVFCDMRIVNDQGQIINDSFWQNRKVITNSFQKLLLANVVTGAASVFRREMLDQILPFPQYITASFHDHWIALCSISSGKVKFVNEPLQDYVQHSQNIIGAKCNLVANRFWQNIWYFLRGFFPWILPKRLRKFRYHGEAFELNDILRIEFLLRSLQGNAGDSCSTTPNDADFDIAKRLSFPILLFRSIASNFVPLSTLKAESQILQSIYWRFVCKRLHSGFYEEKIQEIMGTSPQGYSSDELFGATRYLSKKIAGLDFTINDEEKSRINILIPAFNSNITYGGYITKFHLARLLVDSGFEVRILIVDNDYPSNISKSKGEISSLLGKEGFFSEIEIIDVSNRQNVILILNSHDRVIATTWWTAHIAHQMVQSLKVSNFFYLIQEFEPFTFANGSYKAVAEESYFLEHYPIYSSQTLKTYIENTLSKPEHNAARLSSGVSFKNPITSIKSKDAVELSNTERMKILLYCRPEPHASRNLFELAILAIESCLASDCFDGEMIVNGIGSAVSEITECKFSDSLTIRLYPKMELYEYASFVSDHDIGIALMHTPHPSLVPIEFASGGLVTLTTSYSNKSQEYFNQISQNIVVAQPSVNELKAGLINCFRKSKDFEARVANAKVKWPTVEHPNESLDCVIEFIKSKI